MVRKLLLAFAEICFLENSALQFCASSPSLSSFILRTHFLGCLSIVNILLQIICKTGSFINSRTAIAGAIIRLLLVFYNSKNLNCIGALSFFLRSVHTFS